MSTPRKKFNNYASPYEKPVQQYPSQSEDYISLDMGGMSQSNNAGNNERTPGGFLNTKHFQNSNSKSNRGKNLFNNNAGNRFNRPNYNSQQQDRYTPRKNNDYQQQERFTPRKNYDYQQQQQERYTPRKNNDYQQQERYTPRKNNEGFQNRNQHNAKSASPSIAAYCHPSMTQDPWRELMERVQAIGKSKISIKTSPLQNEAAANADETLITTDSDENADGSDSVASD